MDFDKSLDDSAEKLEKELEVLTFSHPGLKYSVSHDSEGALLVYAPRMVKPYLPKIYDGWDVTFVESASGQMELSIDQQLDFEI